MKSIFLITISLLLGITSAFAVELSDIEGTYEVTTELAPIMNVITISKDGEVELTEHSPEGSYTCTGMAVITDDILVSEVVCENGEIFEQRIDLTGIESFESFTANVYSSLYGMELPLDFKKIQE